MTHFPYNPKCPTCVRANKRRKAHRRGFGKNVNEATKFGESFTMDYVSNHREQVKGLIDEREALIVVDHHTRWTQVFPMKGKTALQVQMCLYQISGKVQVFKVLL